MKKKAKKLTDYLKRPSMHLEGEGGKEEVRAAESGFSVEEIIETAVKRFKQGSEILEKQAGSKPLELPPREQAALPEAAQARAPVAVPEVLVKLAEAAYQSREVKMVTCEKQGVCSDNRHIGEIFEDERGVKWQRGFIRTTRNPIFLDFIVESGEVKGYVGKALIIETERGAKAIIPEEFICEMAARYGLQLKIDKCIGYKTSPWVERGRARKR
ncbi:MAG: hypothetical protein ACP5KA_00125 [Desulfurococcaceae archaeon]